MGKRELSDQEIADAQERGRTAAETEPRAAAAWYDAAKGRVMVELRDGCLFGFPADRAQGLRGAAEEDLSEVRVMPGGAALQWDRLDAGFTVPGLLAGAFGTEKWMSQAAATMGRMGGGATSEAKRAAARVNGQKGGRPRKNTVGAEAVGRALTATDRGRGARQSVRVANEIKRESVRDKADGGAGIKQGDVRRK